MINTEENQNYFGVYYGTVEENHDPLGLGRLRIRTPIESDKKAVPTSALHWASYVAPSGGTKDAGHYFVPPIGAQVVVQYVGGHAGYPVWLGTVWGAPDGVPDGFTARLNDVKDSYGISTGPGWDYTKVQTIVTPAGHKLVWDDNGEQQNNRSIQLSTSSGIKLWFVEDKTHQHVESPKAYAELSTPDGRKFVFDDELETHTITTPDGHRVELNSRYDFYEVKTSTGYRLRFDEPAEELYLNTPNGSETGHTLWMSNAENRVVMRTKNGFYHMTASDESGGYFGMIGNEYPSLEGSGFLLNQTVPGMNSAYMFANSGQDKASNAIVASNNGAMRAVGMYDNFDGPTCMIRLISQGGLPLSTHIGMVDNSATIKTLPTGTVSVAALTTISLQSPTIALTSILPGGCNLLIQNAAGLTLPYAAHTHMVDLNTAVPGSWYVIDPQTSAQLPVLQNFPVRTLPVNLF